MPNLKRIKKKLKDAQKYTIYTDNLRLPIKEKAFLMEAGQGKHVNGNVFAMIRCIRAHREYDEYDIFVVVTEESKDRAKNKFAYYGINNLTFVERLSEEYYKALATAKYLMTDNSFPPNFFKREEQVYVNTWHGTPLKVLGRADIASSTSIGNVQGNFLKADYLLFPNNYCMDIMMQDYMISRIFGHKTVVLDYPRNDALHNDQLAKKTSDKFCMRDKRLIAYMPTWRGVGRTASVEEQIGIVGKQIGAISGVLREDEILCVNLHFLIGNNIDLSMYDNVMLFPEEYETYDFLSACDVLITDYSSVMIDFAATGKEVILYMYDYEDYLRDKGFYFDIKQLPFKRAFEINELAHVLHSDPVDVELEKSFKGNHYGCASEALLRLWCGGNACDLIVNDHSGNNDTELVYMGNLHNDNSRILLGDYLSRLTDVEKDNTVLVFDSKIDRTTSEILKGIDSNVHFLIVQSKQHKRTAELLSAKLYMGKGVMEKSACEYYKREAARMFGQLNYKEFIYLFTTSLDRFMVISAVPGRKIAFIPNELISHTADVSEKLTPGLRIKILERYDKKLVYPSAL